MRIQTGFQRGGGLTVGIQNSSAELKLHAGIGEQLNAMVVGTSASPLTKALVSARKAVTGTVKKDGRFEGGRGGSYSYVGHEQVVQHARQALLDNGLSLTQVGVEFLGSVSWPKADGREQTVLRWRGLFELSHESGASRQSFFDCLTLGSDKAGFVASTALDRTALLRTLQLAGTDEDDPEHNSNNPPAQQQAPAENKANAARDDAKLAAAQREQYARQLREAIDVLASLEAPAELMDWGVALLEHEADKDAKLTAWGAWGKRSKELGLDPADLKVGALKAFNGKHGG